MLNSLHSRITVVCIGGSKMNTISPNNYSSVNDYANYWLALRRESSRINDTTLENERGMLQKHVLPVIGEKQISTLISLDLNLVYRGMLEKGLTNNYIYRVSSVMHQMITSAYYHHLIPENPCLHARKPRVEHSRMICFTEEDIKTIIPLLLSDTLGRMYLVALYTGLKTGELLALSWDSLDNESHRLTISQRFYKPAPGTGHNIAFLESTYNGHVRTIPVCDSCLKILHSQKREQDIQKNSTRSVWMDTRNLIFTRPNGHHYSFTDLLNYNKKLQKKTGIPYFNLKTFRNHFGVMKLYHNT